MKRPVPIIILLLVVSFVFFYAVQQIANYRRGQTIEKYLSAMRTTILEGGIDEGDIQYEKDCGRNTQVVFGQGKKSCSRQLEVEEWTLKSEQVKELHTKIRNATDTYQGAQVVHDENRDFKMDQEGKYASSVTSVELSGKVSCSIFIRYQSIARDGQRIGEPDIGDMLMTIGCNDTSWWIRTLDI